MNDYGSSMQMFIIRGKTCHVRGICWQNARVSLFQANKYATRWAEITRDSIRFRQVRTHRCHRLSLTCGGVEMRLSGVLVG